MKRLIALLLCLAALICALASCSKEKEDDKSKETEEEVVDLGAYVNMYISDQVYNFDPASAYQNESALKIVSLLYDNLFVLNEDGEVEKSLVKKYKIDKQENTMLLTLRDDCYWSDGTPVSADNVTYAWSRILDSAASYDAAVLLYDVKNARACKEGDIPSIDDVGIQAINKSQLLIEFNEGVNYDNFLYNLTSYALVPLRSDIVITTVKPNDWSKVLTATAASGPFRVRDASYIPGEETIVLERNSYYRRDAIKDPLDKAVTPYRLIIDYSKSDEEIWKAYEEGQIFFIGDIPFSLRSKYSLEDWEDEADITDSLSTHSYVFNQNAVIRKYDAAGFELLAQNGSYDAALVDGVDGNKIFSNIDVRNALSLAIPRDTIANLVVFAEPANGLVPNGVFNSTSPKHTFREEDGDKGIAAQADIAAAKKLLEKANINPSDYMFAISVAGYDDVHLEIAKAVQSAWGKDGLGFNVAIHAINAEDNKDFSVTTNEVISRIKDDIFQENYVDGKFDVAAIDYVALSTDAFSSLAPFAKGYTGGASIDANSSSRTFTIATHRTGYNSEKYNAIIDKAFAEKDLEKRAEILHEAEELLMSEMPIAPIVFNKNATLTSKELKKVEFNGYEMPILNKIKLKDYERFTPVEETKQKETDADESGDETQKQ